MHVTATPEIDHLINTLKEFLTREKPRYLEHEFESAAKHIAAYFKIVHGHIAQLEQLLATENHGCKTIKDIELAEPVQQLMTIFDMLQEADVHHLDNLVHLARAWKVTNHEVPQSSEEAATADDD